MAMRPDDPRLTVAHSILLKLLDHKTVQCPHGDLDHAALDGLAEAAARMTSILFADLGRTAGGKKGKKNRGTD
jgi:hypothetical protein